MTKPHKIMTFSLFYVETHSSRTGIGCFVHPEKATRHALTAFCCKEHFKASGKGRGTIIVQRNRPLTYPTGETFCQPTSTGCQKRNEGG